jgi:nucleotide-binding universal stress UspA family protein
LINVKAPAIRRAQGEATQPSEEPMGPIVAATDLSSRSDRALRRAARMATRLGAELHILHVLDEDLPAAILQRRTEEAEATLAALIEADPDLKAASPGIAVEAGSLARLLPRVAEERGAGLVVLGSHRNRGLAELVGSPTLSRVMKALTAPLLVAVLPPDRPHAKALAGWDFSPASDAAVALARRVAPLTHLTLLHAWADPLAGAPYAMDIAGTATPARQAGIDEALAEARTRLATDGVAVETEAMVGGPARALVDRAVETGTDLLVIGRHARSGFARFFLGETAERTALTAPCDVLIAPPA